MYYVKEVARDVATAAGLTQVITLAVSAAGNNTLLIAATAGATGTTTTITGITDSQGNTYELAISRTSASMPFIIAKSTLATALGPGDTITLTYGNSVDEKLACVHEFGLVTNGAVDRTAVVGSAATTNPSSGATATTTQADELLFSAVSTDWASTVPSDIFTPTVVSPVWNELASVLTTGSRSKHRGLHPMYRFVTATGAYTGSGTLSAAKQWVAGIATYPQLTAVPRSQAVIIG